VSAPDAGSAASSPSAPDANIFLYLGGVLGLFLLIEP
jgi:hypothetical protein